MERHLEHAPLVEALLEVRWKLHQESPDQPPADRAYPMIVGLLYERIKKGFPYTEYLPQSRLPPAVLQHVVTHRFRVESGAWPLVQVGPGIASINYTGSYTWPRFRRDALALIKHLDASYEVALGAPPELEQVMLRYINNIPVALPKPNVLDILKDWLHMGIAFPVPKVVSSDTNSRPGTLAFLAGYSLDRPRGTASISVATGVRESQPVLLLELVFTAAGSEIPTSQRFWQWLDRAHGILEDWFFELIEGPLYGRFRGGN